MKKEYYEKFINPADFAALYNEWSAAGKPQGNHPLYIKIWEGVTNAVKACVGSLQNRYHCKYQDYEDKVMNGTILMMKKMLTMEGAPDNIVSMCYLPVLGICCSQKAIAKEKEDNMLSLDSLTDCGDTFYELIYLNEDGEVHYGYDSL